jgi:hypothetical protein
MTTYPRESPPDLPTRRSRRTAVPPPRSPRPAPRSHQPPIKLFLGAILLGGLLLATADRWSDSSASPQSAPVSVHPQCDRPVPRDIALSEEQILALLTVPERQVAQDVQQLLGDPHCTLPSLQLRAGVTAERSLYALAVSPQTWLVVLYEEDEYAGYAFDVQP